MDQLTDKLEGLFAAYRDACPDPEPSADFMPGLWRKIEARRSQSLNVLKRLTQVFVGATAVLTIVMAALVIPAMQNSPVYSATYLDVLADHNIDDTAYAGVLPGEEAR
jgi:hypothetical protein